MAKAVRILPILKQAPTLTTLASSINTAGQSYSFGSYSWYNQMIQSSYQRLMRYNDYDMMDEDGDVSKALDIIADEIVGTIELGSRHQLEVDVVDEELPTNTLEILKMALRVWVETIGIDRKVHHIARNLIKYGDCFFLRAHHNSKWIHVPARLVVNVVVDERDATTPLAWNIKADGNSVYQRLLGGDAVTTSGQGKNAHQVALATAGQIVRFTTNDDMSQTAPFGESLLKPAIRAFKQKQLIEDAVIIYRVQRAPERRVFYIDVGSAPLPIRAQVLEQIKTEIKQKKVPRNVAGTDPTEFNGGYDKVLDPLSTNEDYFFPIAQDSRGSRVETLPGGANVGEVADLDIWRRALWRALKIPYSYIEDGSDQAGVINDGKSGVAYIQELNFNMMIQRIQQQLNAIFDREFKQYLKENDIIIDSDKFNIKLPIPQNFAAYRQQAVDADLLSNFSQVDGIGYISKRFAMERFMMMTRDEIMQNERDLKEEMGLDPDDMTIPGHLLYTEEFRLQIIEEMKNRIIINPDNLKLDPEDSPEGFGDGGSDFGGGGGGGGGGGSFGGGMGGDLGGDMEGGDELGGEGDLEGDLGGDDLGGDDGDLGGDDLGGDDTDTPDDEPKP